METAPSGDATAPDGSTPAASPSPKGKGPPAKGKGKGPPPPKSAATPDAAQTLTPEEPTGNAAVADGPTAPDASASPKGKGPPPKGKGKGPPAPKSAATSDAAQAVEEAPKAPTEEDAAAAAATASDAGASPKGKGPPPKGKGKGPPGKGPPSPDSAASPDAAQPPGQAVEAPTEQAAAADASAAPDAGASPKGKGPPAKGKGKGPPGKGPPSPDSAASPDAAQPSGQPAEAPAADAAVADGPAAAEASSSPKGKGPPPKGKGKGPPAPKSAAASDVVQPPQESPEAPAAADSSVASEASASPKGKGPPPKGKGKGPPGKGPPSPDSATSPDAAQPPGQAVEAAPPPPSADAQTSAADLQQVVGTQEAESVVDEEYEALMAKWGSRKGRTAAVRDTGGPDVLVGGLPTDAVEPLPDAPSMASRPRSGTFASPGAAKRCMRTAVRKVMMMRRVAMAFHRRGGRFNAAEAFGQLEVSLIEDEEHAALMENWGSRRVRTATISEHAEKKKDDTCVVDALPSNAVEDLPAAPWEQRPAWQPPEPEVQSVCTHVARARTCTTSFTFGGPTIPSQLGPHSELFAAIAEFKDCVSRLTAAAADPDHADTASLKMALSSLLGSASNTADRLTG